ncbi:MAG: dipeptide ABC transporter ATP-binding protein [Myxococcota bacterium]|nr:dipeptide ABC transporter ATP-binding protein [Myxococcota bacterium]
MSEFESNTTEDAEPILQIKGLKTWFHTDDGVVKAVNDVTFDIAAGQTLGLVGESGSGKSVTSLTVMQLLPEISASIRTGSEILFMGKNLLEMTKAEVRGLRGNDMAMIFQEPMTSLNPVFTVGDQVAEALVLHRKISKAEALARTVALFDLVGIPDPKMSVKKYPHEMSGGQKQRVMIAMALSCDPRLLIADEPTTALDVTIQAQILDLMRKMRDEYAMAMLFITHDLGVIAEIADKVAVMFRGKLVEFGDVVSVFENPQHAYTKSLLNCRPRLENRFFKLPTVADYLDVWKSDDGEWQWKERPDAEAFIEENYVGKVKRNLSTEGEPLLSVRDLKVHFPIRQGIFQRVVDHVRAVDGIDFDVYPGQTLGLVGESGCGKTTTGRAILRLIEPTAGTVTFQGKDLGSLNGSDMREIRRNLQIIFQDPYSSLNPRLTVEQAITEPMKIHGLGSSDKDRRDRCAALLEEVGLGSEHMNRYPHEFSGGQRQRICIARTLAVEPKFIICDESVSALDVSVQAQVLNLLNDLKEKRDLTYIFISHDLSVVKFMSDIMCVMKAGKIVEVGPADDIYAAPEQEYTRSLIEAIPKDSLDNIRMRQKARIDAAVARNAR